MEYYKILNVSKDASIDEIKKQYKKMALKHHPDRGGDPEMFKKISEAYQTLSDPEKRNMYDNPNPFFSNINEGNNPNFNPQHFVDPNIMFQQFFGNNDFFQQQNPHVRNTTTFNIRTSSMNGMGGFGQNVFQKSVSTQIRGDTKIETTTEIKNGVKTQTVKQTNMKTGATLTNINQIGI